MSQINTNVRRLYINNDFTKTQIAKAAGVSRRTVQRMIGAADGNPLYEGYVPSEDSAAAIAALFDLTTQKVSGRILATNVETAAQNVIKELRLMTA